MTDFPPLPPLPEPQGDDADLLASLYLDGEATAEERALVEADPLLLERVETFRSLAVSVSSVTSPAGLAASQIASALDAFGAGSTAVSSAAPVTSLADHPRRRRQLPSWLGAAAVAALVVGGIGFATTRSGSENDATDAAAPSLSASATNDSDGADEAADGDMADDAAMSTEMVEEATALEGETSDSGGDLAADDTGSESEEPAAELAPTDRATEIAVAKAFYEENGPFSLADLDAETAAGFFDLLVDAPLLPIEESPCADSPVVTGLDAVDSFIPVVFEDAPASLIVQSGDPTTALIIGETCEVELS